MRSSSRAAERGLREFLSSWQFWMVLAYLGLGTVVIFLFVLSGKQARIQAQTAAASQSNATTQVGQCFTAVRNAPVTRRFLAAHEALIQNSVLANKAALRLASPHDPLHNVRVQSLARLRKAQDNADELGRLFRRMTPTRRKCVLLAARRGVDASRYTHLHR